MNSRFSTHYIEKVNWTVFIYSKNGIILARENEVCRIRIFDHQYLMNIFP
jgi:hypothetical protein